MLRTRILLPDEVDARRQPCAQVLHGLRRNRRRGSRGWSRLRGLRMRENGKREEERYEAQREIGHCAGL